MWKNDDEYTILSRFAEYRHRRVASEEERFIRIPLIATILMGRDALIQRTEVSDRLSD